MTRDSQYCLLKNGTGYLIYHDHPQKSNNQLGKFVYAVKCCLTLFLIKPKLTLRYDFTFFDRTGSDQIGFDLVLKE